MRIEYQGSHDDDDGKGPTIVVTGPPGTSGEKKRGCAALGNDL